MAKMNSVPVKGMLIDRAGKTLLLLLRSWGGRRGDAGIVPSTGGHGHPLQRQHPPPGLRGTPQATALVAQPTPTRLIPGAPNPKKQLVGLILPWGELWRGCPQPCAKSLASLPPPS